MLTTVEPDSCACQRFVNIMVPLNNAACVINAANLTSLEIKMTALAAAALTPRRAVVPPAIMDTDTCIVDMDIITGMVIRKSTFTGAVIVYIAADIIVQLAMLSQAATAAVVIAALPLFRHQNPLPRPSSSLSL